MVGPWSDSPWATGYMWGWVLLLPPSGIGVDLPGGMTAGSGVPVRVTRPEDEGIPLLPLRWGLSLWPWDP